jgi:hypothetical protein
LDAKRVQFVPPSTAWRRPNKLGSPIHDARGRFDAVLAAQLRGYSIEDPGTKQSQAIPAAVVALMEAVSATELHKAVGQLSVGAFFFAMRACEFSDVGGPRRTRTITLGDLEFRRGGKKIDGDDEDELSAADTVSITFRTQKNGEKGTTVTQHKAAGAAIGGAKICPVTSLARLVARVSRYDSSESKWEPRDQRPINLFESANGLALVTSNQILHHLRAAALQY